MRREIRFAGFGGQGIALAGYVLGRAFALYDGLEAVMTQSYGPEARGGASSASVVVSDHQIAYPFVQRTDVLIAFSQEAYAKFVADVKTDGIILVDRDLVEYQSDHRHHAIPATKLADDLGRRIVANMVMLGFFAGITGYVSMQAVERAIESTVKPATVELNVRALACGHDYVQQEEPTR